MRKGILLLLIMAAAGMATAQTVILDVEPDLDSISNKFGPNRTHFVHLFLGYGVNLGSQDPAARIRLGSSNIFQVGLRYKLKFSNTLSAVADIGLQNLTYDLVQEKGKLVPDTVLHDRERYFTQNFQLSGYFRINFGERGDRIGNFIDLGGGFLARLRRQYDTRDELPNGEIKEVQLTKLNVITPIQYFTELRLGLNRWTFFATRRMTPFFTDETGYPELPHYTVGIQFGLH